MDNQNLKILYEDEWFVSVDKPADLLVHRTSISSDRIFLLQMLRDQLGARVYPVHRLDRPTSGVIFFARDKESLAGLSQLFREGEVHKRYLAVVRGYVNERGVIDYPLKNPDTEVIQDAVTEYNPLIRAEIPVGTGRYNTSRYTLVEVFPKTGRMHQIRRHFAHLRHPVIGDVKHGDGRHNRTFREQYNVHRLMLMASDIAFRHPVTGEDLKVSTSPEGDFLNLINSLFSYQDSEL